MLHARSLVNRLDEDMQSCLVSREFPVELWYRECVLYFVAVSRFWFSWLLVSGIISDMPPLDRWWFRLYCVYRELCPRTPGTGGRSLSSLLGVVLAIVPGDSPTLGLLLTLGVLPTPSSSPTPGLLLTCGVLGVPTLPTFGVLLELLLLPNPLFIILPRICTSSAASSNMSSSMPSCALYTSRIVCCASLRLPSPSCRQSYR